MQAKSAERSQTIASYFAESARVIASLDALSSNVERAADAWISALSTDRKVMFCGNGGSAADAQHLAAEIIGRYRIDRAPMAALSLTVDTSALTAIANDYGYDTVFSRQVLGLGRPGDVLVGLSTSGNSRNVVKAFEAAREIGVVTIGMTGEQPGLMGPLSDILIPVPHKVTSHIQEAHIVIGHLICGIVETTLCAPKP
ncbi:D-sedoheptulose 7-phosphate isomerase [Azorhizobium caulinodans]|uniref:D-sedoheptulose-7-phosphate isomerase n=1 Tax=Azorhizobium caulinodans TaxID=7 RepID=UPI002FBEF289